MIRTVAIATLVCLASWVGLAVGAGNVGLQRTISAGPLALLESPLAVVLSTALAFAVTVALCGAGRDTRTSAWGLVGAVLVGDAIGAVVVAPALIGELEIGHAPVVFVVLTTLGLQPLAVGLAGVVRRRGGEGVIVGLFALALLACLGVAGCAPAGVPHSSGEPSVSASLGVDPDSGLPLVALPALPPEAAETMALIATDGPYPFRQDGAVFENREGILPDADDGYYHEFTVETPGSSDRGARRIVVGNQGEAYWTDDHYDSFWRIAP